MKLRIAATLLTLLPLLHLDAQVPTEFPGHRTITVTGSATVQVAPDYARIQLQAVTENPSLLVAKQENDQRIVKVQEVARGFGLKPEDIQMQYASIERNIVNDEKAGTRKITGYTVKKSVTLIVHDLARFETLINDLLHAGINELQTVEFKSSDAAKHQAQAREAAILNARETASALAQKLGQKIGKPLTIGESYITTSENYSASRIYGGPPAFQSEAVLPDTEAGMLSFPANILVMFELE